MKRAACLALACSALLAACGQRGALYLPDQEREPVATTSPAGGAAGAAAGNAAAQPAPAADATAPAPAATEDNADESKPRASQRP